MNQLWDYAGNKLAAGVLTTPMPRYFSIFPSKQTAVRSGCLCPFLLYMNDYVGCVGDIEKEKFKKLLTTTINSSIVYPYQTNTDFQSTGRILFFKLLRSNPKKTLKKY